MNNVISGSQWSFWIGDISRIQTVSSTVDDFVDELCSMYIARILRLLPLPALQSPFSSIFPFSFRFSLLLMASSIPFFHDVLGATFFLLRYECSISFFLANFHFWLSLHHRTPLVTGFLFDPEWYQLHAVCLISSYRCHHKVSTVLF